MWGKCRSSVLAQYRASLLYGVKEMVPGSNPGGRTVDIYFPLTADCKEMVVGSNPTRGTKQGIRFCLIANRKSR